MLNGRRVFLTGHTGFKGSWLLVWLHSLGAQVTGYSLQAAQRSMYRQLELDEFCTSQIGDVRDREKLTDALAAARPDIVFHLAAQALVLASYEDPLGTLHTNVIGTANVLEALRTIGRPCTTIIVTSDKCYDDPREPRREEDCLGGHDPYSASKAAAEIVTAAYRRSFNLRVATARAGNVIGGGDWADDRILPDCIRALEQNRPIRVRNPRYVRPWQHVVEPLRGYLALAERLDEDDAFAGPWNFGPGDADSRTVQDVVEAAVEAWGHGEWKTDQQEQPRETTTLRLNIDKARKRLGWSPRWSFEESVARSVAWYRAAHEGASSEELRMLTRAQIGAQA